MVDNFWLHDDVEKSEIMLGFIGDLAARDPPDFARHSRPPASQPALPRHSLRQSVESRSRCGRAQSDFISGLKLLAQAGLVLETANPDAALISAIVEMSDRVPELRIVLDHLPARGSARRSHRLAQNLRRRICASSRSVRNIFVKGSEIVRRIDGKVSLDIAILQGQPRPHVGSFRRGPHLLRQRLAQ